MQRKIRRRLSDRFRGLTRGPLARLARRFPRLARLARGTHRVYRRVADVVPFTPLGCLVAIGAYLCWTYMGGERMDQVLTIVAQVAAGLSVLAVFSVVVATFRLRRLVRRSRSDFGRGQIDAAHAALTGFEAPSLRFTPLVQVRWEWESPTGFVAVQIPAARGQLGELITADGRGLHKGLTRRFVVEDSLGLSRLAFRMPEELSPPLRVLPDLGKLKQSSVVSTLAGGDELPHPLGTLDGDRLELRRYNHGDPARLIVWKIFGRTRRLIVRMPERALARAHSVAAYIVTGDDDEAAAATARVAVETGALGTQWVLGADGVARDVHREEEALELIAASGSAGSDVTEAGGLPGFIKRNERQGTVRYLVFAPARSGRWVERVAAIASRRRGLLDVIVSGDGIGRRNSFGWKSLLWRSPDAPTVSALEVEKITTTLAGSGVRVAVIDRPSGQVVTPVQLLRTRKVA